MTGESPIVDVQSAKRQRTLDSDLVQSLPTAKGYAGLMVLIPSMVQSGGGVPERAVQPRHGGVRRPRRPRQRRAARRWTA